uniref:Uncharacterized protein n=1 Tax=Anguilla anguilla TaxID=7936 RepID=A0A0E9RJI4_ANGAN
MTLISLQCNVWANFFCVSFFYICLDPG